MEHLLRGIVIINGHIALCGAYRKRGRIFSPHQTRHYVSQTNVDRMFFICVCVPQYKLWTLTDDPKQVTIGIPTKSRTQTKTKWGINPNLSDVSKTFAIECVPAHDHADQKCWPSNQHRLLLENYRNPFAMLCKCLRCHGVAPIGTTAKITNVFLGYNGDFF